MRHITGQQGRSPVNSSSLVSWKYVLPDNLEAFMFHICSDFQPGASLCARMPHRSWEPSVFFFQTTARFEWHADGLWMVGEVKKREKIWSHKKIYKQYEVSDVTGLLPNEIFRTNLVTHGACYDFWHTENSNRKWFRWYYPYVRQVASGCFCFFLSWCPTCLATSVGSWLDPDYRFGSSQFLGGLYGVLVIICTIFFRNSLSLSRSL